MQLCGLEALEKKNNQIQYLNSSIMHGSFTQNRKHVHTYFMRETGPFQLLMVL